MHRALFCCWLKNQAAVDRGEQAYIDIEVLYIPTCKVPPPCPESPVCYVRPCICSLHTFTDSSQCVRIEKAFELLRWMERYDVIHIYESRDTVSFGVLFYIHISYVHIYIYGSVW